jgi:hypothetical protein
MYISTKIEAAHNAVGPGVMAASMVEMVLVSYLAVAYE